MTEIGREYGEGLYALCLEEGMTAEVLDEINLLSASFDEQSDFTHLLSNRSIPRQERLQVLDDTFRGKINPYVLNFLKILLEKGMLNEFPDCAKAFYEACCRDQDIAEALVTTASPLSDEQMEKIRQKLSAMTGKKITLQTKIDQSLLGGVLLEMDGKRYDDTIKGRLMNIRSSMVGDNEDFRNAID